MTTHELARQLPEPYNYVARWLDYISLEDVLDLGVMSFSDMDYRFDRVVGIFRRGRCIGYIPYDIVFDTRRWSLARYSRDIEAGLPMVICNSLFTNGLRPLVPADYLAEVARISRLPTESE